jgi:hypothetical protein
VLRALSPPLAQMAAVEAGLSGSYRAAHQRLVAAAEEVAFNDPPAGEGGPRGACCWCGCVRRACTDVQAWGAWSAPSPKPDLTPPLPSLLPPPPPSTPAGQSERLILDGHLRRLVRYGRLSSLQRLMQGVMDGYAVKYLASCVALLVYAAPFYFQDPAVGWGWEGFVWCGVGPQQSAPRRPTCTLPHPLPRLPPLPPCPPTQLRSDQGQLTADYIRSMRLLQNTSSAVGDLIMTYKRVSNLAGHTARVAELLEQVHGAGRDWWWGGAGVVVGQAAGAGGEG